MDLDRKNIQIKLNEIDKILFRLNVEDCSLLEGNAGILLFYLHLYKNNRKSIYLDKINALTNKCIKALSLQTMPFTFCSGVAGIVWVLVQVQKSNLLSFNKGLFKEIDIFLLKSSLFQMERNNYDYLHGALGSILFWLERLPDSEVETYIEAVIVKLIEKSEIKDGCAMWRDGLTEQCRYDMGLSHGIPSILVILSLVYSKGILKEQCKNIIHQGVRWILKSKSTSGKCVFPSYFQEDHKFMSKYSRLGWCYGDLGVAIMLWQVGKRLINPLLQEEAINVIKKTCNRRNLKNNDIYDAGLCHGSIGVAFIYKRFYNWTGQNEFKKNSDYWYSKSLEFANFKDGHAGYKTWQGKAKIKYINDHSLLEGLTGIGLALLSEVSKDDPDWDRCLLIS